MTIGCNIGMICLKLNWFFYGLSRMLQFSQFAWTPCYSVWDFFNNFLLIDATDKSKISGDQKRFFIAFSLYPLSFFANTPFKVWLNRTEIKVWLNRTEIKVWLNRTEIKVWLNRTEIKVWLNRTEIKAWLNRTEIKVWFDKIAIKDKFNRIVYKSFLKLY